MKRLVFVLCLLLAFVTVASADEIVFRQIPWGTNSQEVRTLLFRQFSEAEKIYTYLTDKEEEHMPYLEGMRTTIGSRPCTAHKCGYANHLFVGGVKVAGYDLLAITTYAHFGESRDITDSRLYAARYELAVNNVELAYFDMQSKLSHLYGECTSKQKSFHWKGVTNYTCESTWCGDNNTAVSMYASYSDDKDEAKNGEVVIVYYLSDCDEILGVVDEAAERWERENPDVSGL